MQNIKRKHPSIKSKRNVPQYKSKKNAVMCIFVILSFLFKSRNEFQIGVLLFKIVSASILFFSVNIEKKAELIKVT